MSGLVPIAINADGRASLVLISVEMSGARVLDR